MRVTNQFLFDNFKDDHSRVLKNLSRLTSQVSSGQKIQNSYEDSAVYSDVLRLESQEVELEEIKKRSIVARTNANATDSALSEFTQTLRDFKTKIIAASNATLNEDNREAIAMELKEQKKHMISLANSQIGGQYLFSGSSVNVKPIDSEGDYHGNGDALMTLVGDGVKVQSNIDGKSLFLGDDINVHKSIKTNVKLTNQLSDEPLTSQSSIKDMIGDEFNDDIRFFISGIKSDGEAFKSIKDMSPDMNIEKLLNDIAIDYGSNVKVELTENGNISITDLQAGYSQMEFKMVGVQGVDDLNEKNLNNVTGDKIISFSTSNYKSVGAVDESLQMDQQYFEKNGGVLESNVALLADGAFVDSTTKLSSMTSKSLLTDVDGNKIFTMNLTNINGVDKEVTLTLDGDSTFSIDGKDYTIYDADGVTETSADDFTMGQLQNIISMTLSDTLPANDPGTSTEFETAVTASKKLIDVSINQSGHLKIVDNSSKSSNIEFSLYDTDANDFSETTTPSISFMSNNAITTQKANINFFDEIDQIIEAVENGVMDLDSDAKDPRNIGLQNSLNTLDQMNTHFGVSQSKIGIRSRSLEISEQKADALKVNVAQLKSETTEVDIAETILKLNQTTLSYQAMLQTITKVNSLSLLNYLK